MLVAVCSVKSAPGVTTFAIALAACWPAPVRCVLVECDPSGGDVATRFSLASSPGLVSLAAAARRRTDLALLWQHTQALPGGLPVVVAPPGADQARAALEALVPEGSSDAAVFRELIASPGVVVVADCGRIDPASPVVPVARSADAMVLVSRAHADSLAHLATRLATVGRWSRRPALVLTGPGYPTSVIERELGVPVIARIPEDRRRRRSGRAVNRSRTGAVAVGAHRRSGGRRTGHRSITSASGRAGPARRGDVAAGAQRAHTDGVRLAKRIIVMTTQVPPNGAIWGRPAGPYPADGPAGRPSLPDASAEQVMGLRRLRHRLRDELAAKLAAQVDAQHQQTGQAVAPEARRELGRRILEDAVEAHSVAELHANRPLVSKEDEQAAIAEAINEMFGMASLQPLLDDPGAETINVNRFDRVFVQYAGGHRAQVAPIAESNEELTDLVRVLAARASSEERRFDRGSPSVNLQLPGGERLFAVMGLTAGGVTSLSIRRPGYRTATLSELRMKGTVDPGLQQFLRALVRARRNILITGGTSAGKTTLLRALASEMDPLERIVTIEDAFELGLEIDPTLHADVTAFQAREANVEGEGAISQADLVRWALRMSPDRVIVGEIRGPEVIPMCNAMSQGNDGSMATLHASSSRIAFTRLAAYAAQGPEKLPLEATNLLVASAVHFVVHLAMAPDRCTRVVSSIREVVGSDCAQVISNEVYRPGADRRARPVAGALRTDTLEDLIAAGLDPGVLEQPEGWWPR